MLIFSTLNLRQELVEFTLEDCPVYFSDNRVVLAKHEGSSILRADTIVRKDTETGVAEGDCVFQGGAFLGIVVYNQGFKLQTIDGKIKDLQQNKYMKVRQGKKFNMCDATHSANRQPISLFYKGRTFSIKALLQYEEPFVVIHPQDDYFRKVLPGDIKISTGIGKYCYGDLMAGGGRIVLHDGIPCVAEGGNLTRLCEIGGKQK